MEKIKQNRVWSFVIVALVYIIASALGILIFNLLNLEWWLGILIADCISTAIVFIFSLIFKNASVYDPYWSVQPIVIAFGASTLAKVSSAGLLLIIAITLWGVRLTLNWAYTFKSLNHQDWRYTMLKEKTGRIYPLINFVGIHMVPTLIVYMCTLPAVYAILFIKSFNPVSIIFFALCIFSFTMQGIADSQMHKYRKTKETPFIRNGLWKYSRHPNYLGEILMWWGVGIFTVINAPSAWYLLLGALLNTLLFLFVSLPMAEKRQAKKEGFQEYKSKTRLLLPIYKK
ncbi:MAG: DUF1295 domain-containing protein [Clostridia bacterium]|nr:DUF1295 domain-containing protein [Clostridia bacterium]